MNFSSWVQANRARFGSEYEVLFAEQVLPLVDGLAPDAVEVQYPFVDSDGKTRYCDFVIFHSQAMRLAIEIDGFDKRGIGQGMSYADFLDWQRRQASLASQGWHVLRFANRDVRDNPIRCAKHIKQLLNHLQRSHTERLEGTARQAPTPAAAPPPADLRLTPTPRPTPDGHAPKRGHRTWVLAGLALFVGVIWQLHLAQLQPRTLASSDERVLFSSGASGVHRSEDSRPANQLELSYGQLDCRDAIDWSIAKSRVGQVATIIGPLLETKSRPNVAGSPMWMDIGAVYPSTDRLTIVLWGRNWHKFDLEQLDAGHRREASSGGLGFATVCIRGKIAEYRGAPQIELEEPGQIAVGKRPNFTNGDR